MVLFLFIINLKLILLVIGSLLHIYLIPYFTINAYDTINHTNIMNNNVLSCTSSNSLT